MPRRYSVVMNSTPSTAAMVSAANAPIRTRSIGVPAPPLPGAMSPEPMTVNAPPS